MQLNPNYLRRARWLEKLANMPPYRNPPKFFVSWIPNPRSRGRPQQTIRHAYATTMEFNLARIPKFKIWYMDVISILSRPSSF